jgi:hypothetical protein
MSAIGHSPIGVSFNDKAFLISMHADHRPQDIYFARTQSREFRQLAWKSRMKPWRSWAEIALWALALGLFAAAASSSLML